MNEDATRSKGPPSQEGSDRKTVQTGIPLLDERVSGLTQGGSYLVVGAPGPAKMVAALSFLRAGLAAGEKGVLVTAADANTMLEAAAAWGVDMKEAWLDGRLTVLGFRDDFELRAGRSVEPDEAIDELDAQVGRDATRIVVDPGTPFLSGGARGLLGGAFLRWASSHPATVLVTFAVDGDASALPSSAEWILHSTTGRMVVEPRSGGLYQITLLPSFPGPSDRVQPVSLQLEPGRGLIRPEAFPSRRGGDRSGLDPSRLLLVTLGGANYEFNAWASSEFLAEVVTDPLEAVAAVQGESAYGGVVVHAPRSLIREAMKTFRALRPLTRAALVFTSDDDIRATDRVYLLEAGADDCVTGGVDFRELSVRLRQSMLSGGRAGTPADETGSKVGPMGGDVAPDELRVEVERRMKVPFLSTFSLVALPLRDPAFQGVVEEQLRSEDGDMVARHGERILVVLQGARAGQAHAFLQRLAARAGVDDLPATAEVASHPADADAARRLLEAVGARTG